MSQSVDRLKELLFESEAKSLSDLERRVETLVVDEAQKRADIASRLDKVFERAGTEERFLSSVASVMDAALRQAEVDRHASLSDAIAPLIVKTIKTEIRNSRDELVEALYPMTGQMVKAYVASAMKDLANDINRRLEANPVMLRVRSIMTGKSVAELAMADSQRLQLEELYLVRRGTGELVARWPEGSADVSRDHVLSGILAAINDFSTAALADQGSVLRQIDVGERQLYLRASPIYLLAAKCSGTAPLEVEGMLDDAFLATLERLQSLTAGSDSRKLLSEMSSGLELSVQEKQEELAQERAGISPLKMLAWVIGLPLAGWLAWSLYADYRTDRTHAIASDILSREAAIQGYPTRLDVSRWGSTVTVAGLVPTEGSRAELLKKLGAALPASEIRDRLSVLPSGLEAIEPEIARVRREIAGLEPEIDKVRKDVREIGPQISKFRDEVEGVRGEVSGIDPKVATVRQQMARIEPEIAKIQGDLANLEAGIRQSAVHRTLLRASKRLAEAADDIDTMKANLEQGARQKKADQIRTVAVESRSQLESILREISNSRGATLAEGLHARIASVTARVESALLELSGLLVAAGASVTPHTSGGTKSGGILEVVEDLSAASERLSATAIAVGQSLALKKSLPAPVASVVAAEPTPRARLEAWVRANAIFFAKGTDFREPDRVARTLDDLANVMKDGDLLVRVVGYTDDKGSNARNSPLSRERAEKVASELVARGIPSNRVVAIGRIDGRDLSALSGDDSPNRRVEFEVGFEGEGRR